MSEAYAERLTPMGPIARGCRRVVESSWFDPLMLGVIVLNAIVLGMETYESLQIHREDTDEVRVDKRIRTLKKAVEDLERELHAKRE